MPQRYIGESVSGSALYIGNVEGYGPCAIIASDQPDWPENGMVIELATYSYLPRLQVPVPLKPAAECGEQARWREWAKKCRRRIRDALMKAD